MGLRCHATAGISALCALLLVAGCATQPASRYQQKHDSAPHYSQDVHKVPDAVPRVEPYSRGGNKSPYVVMGKRYWVMPSGLGYAATGTASWYGTKFHGHLTSNGEVYNMYGMTAAHKSLPIPTYVKVTNLNNGRYVIVRVNDRGPFHEDRLIDLSYAAATKLGYAKQGTAPVRVEAIDPVAWQRNQRATVPVAYQPVTTTVGSVQAEGNSQAQLTKAALETRSLAATLDNIYVQVGAFVSFDSANRLKQQVQGMTDQPVTVFLDQQRTPNLHKVQVGPLKDVTLAQQLREMINSNGLGSAMILAVP
ncbi:MAG: septal ring lytic transglycosylase RlpA family protein [Pseudomonadales bacterium]